MPLLQQAGDRWATSVSYPQIDKMTTHFSTLIVISFLTSCTNPETQAKSIDNENRQDLKKVKQSAQVSLLDSVISLPTGVFNPNQGRTVTKEEAERQLYSHFQRKGILPRSEWERKSTSSLKDQIVTLDTIYHLRSQHLSGAVISYWLGPADLNGRCFQPHKALLIYAQSGFKIAKEQFLPTSFTIDSISGMIVYGYEYECGGKGTIRQFKLTLNYWTYALLLPLIFNGRV